jgi:hypothetical protein
MPTPFLCTTPARRYTGSTARRAAVALAVALAGVGATACGGDDGDDEPLAIDLRDTLGTAVVETGGPTGLVVEMNHTPPPSNEPVTALPAPLEACTLLTDEAVATLLGPVEVEGAGERCRWESTAGYLELTLTPIPVGESQRGFADDYVEGLDAYPNPVVGVGQFAFQDLTVDHVEIRSFWGGWTALITSDQPLEAVVAATSGLPTA